MNHMSKLAKAIKRLELIKTLILLEELNEIPAQLAKLSQSDLPEETKCVIDLLNKQMYSEAGILIDNILCSNNPSISVSQETGALKAEIHLLEGKLLESEIEKAEVEKSMLNFDRLFDQIAGKTVHAYLILKKKNKELESKADPGNPVALQEYKEASATCRHFEVSMEATVLRGRTFKELAGATDIEKLKAVYREAAKLCFPGRFCHDPEILQMAEKMFLGLTEAYLQQDMDNLTAILHNLKKESWDSFPTNTIVNDPEPLGKILEQLRQREDLIIATINEIKSLPPYQLTTSGTPLPDYFTKLKSDIEKKIHELQQVNENIEAGQTLPKVKLGIVTATKTKFAIVRNIVQEDTFYAKKSLLRFLTATLKAGGYILNSLTGSFPLTEAFIEKYWNKWDWYYLSRNPNLPWSAEFIEHKKNKWRWSVLSDNEHLPWTTELLEKYKDSWDWKALSANGHLPWTIELLEKYINNWDWKALSTNTGLPWSVELIDKYRDKWVWGAEDYSDCLSGNTNLPWSIEMIGKFENNWNWEHLSSNPSLPWSVPLLESFKNKWYWGSKYYLGGLSDNPNLPWSSYFIDIYKDFWNWEVLSYNQHLEWSPELIEKYKDRWTWQYDGVTAGLSGNKKLPWTKELIIKYEEYWEWGNESGWYGGISDNPAIPWSMELIDKYKYKLRWNELSMHPGVEWSIELIEKYKEFWFWDLLSGNPGLPWSCELIEKYFHLWNWSALKYDEYGTDVHNLSSNHGLPWSPDFLERYKDKWDWRQLLHNAAIPWSIDVIEKYDYKLQGLQPDMDNPIIYEKVISPLIDDEILFKAMSNIELT